MLHYFIDTIGSQGIKAFSLPQSVTKLYGYPQTIFREIAESLLKKANDRNIRAEIIHCFLNNSIKAIVFPKLGKCVMNVLPYEERGLINALDSGYAEAICELSKAQKYFFEALSIHDEWEKYYIDNLDFTLLDAESRRVRNEILEDKKGTEEGRVYDRFLGAATAFGAVDYIEDLTSDVEKRYFVKGRPGTGKSTFLKKIINEASSRGFDVERYHCAFDPNSLDMLIIRGLKVAVFDSTAPHEHFPERENDEILDFYEMASKRNVDREYFEEISGVSARYKEKINMATDCIGRCSNIFAQNEKAYIERIDKKNILCLTEVLAAEIFGG